MKKVLKVLASLVVLVMLAGAGGFLWAKRASASLLGRSVEAHEVDFPIPFPLDSAQIADAGLTPEQADSAALARAVERGAHLVASRYVCTECHGENFGGGVMVDDPLIGSLLGPNITAGAGGKTAAYAPADWDRMVRHGIKPGGVPGAMPSQDFQTMSDEELSDIVAYIRSLPEVDNTVPAVKLGPLGTVLVATGQIQLSVDLIARHDAPHAAYPPAAEPTEEFGRHLAGVCTGCHSASLAGGKVPGGDPSWPPAANLTPVAGGLGDWTYEQFVTFLEEGTRPSGLELKAPMDAVIGYTSAMTDTEKQALWAYLQSLPPTPTPN
ncbi:MAG: hypothetical protein AMXMBFR53_04240 [Gemmatimonadota bacterium]